MIRSVLAFAFAALVLGACGDAACACTGIGNEPASPTPPHRAAGFDVLVTENDHAVTVHPGERIELVLHARPGMSTWSGVTVDDPAVLRAVPTGITAAIGVTIAGFEALKPGTAAIRATATPLCSPGQACPQFAMEFEVTVTVT